MATYVLNCFESSSLKATAFFAILTIQDGSESDFPETKFETITF